MGAYSIWKMPRGLADSKDSFRTDRMACMGKNLRRLVVQFVDVGKRAGRSGGPVESSVDEFRQVDGAVDLGPNLYLSFGSQAEDVPDV